jgi:hypothetical protein
LSGNFRTIPGLFFFYHTWLAFFGDEKRAAPENDPEMGTTP